MDETAQEQPKVPATTVAVPDTTEKVTTKFGWREWMTVTSTLSNVARLVVEIVLSY